MSSSESTRFCVYIHKRKDNNAIFYVGKGSTHRAYNKSTRNRFWKIVHRKAGGRSVEIVGDFDTETEALQHELFLTWSLRLFGVKLTNLVDGGGGTPGWRHKESTRAIMSLKRKGVALGEEHAAAIRQGVRTPEARAAKRAAQLKRFADPAQIAASRVTAKEANSRPEVRAKISASLSAARRENGSVRPVVCVQTGQEFECIVDAAKWLAPMFKKTLKQARLGIQNSLRGEQYSYLGYRWQYLTTSQG